MVMDEDQAHVAVLAFPFGSHASPLLSIILRLASLSSPATRFSFFGTRASNASTLNGVVSPPNLRAYDVSDGIPEGYVFTGRPQEEIELFIGAARESFKEGMERAAAEIGGRVTCLVSDAFFWFCGEMAEEIGGVPWLAFWTAGPQSLSTHVYTESLRESFGARGEGALSGREDELLKSIPGMSKIKVTDLPEGVVAGRLDSVFSNMLLKMGQTLLLADAVFINSFEELDPEFYIDLKSKFRSYLNIGPLNLVSPLPKSPEAYNCIEWLDTHRAASVVYIGFGTVMMPPPHEVAALADALEAKGVPFLWSLRDSGRVHLPAGFLDRTTSSRQGLVVPWAPQNEILGHKAVGVFVTHGGWNSVLESMVGGVPMICRPFFGDQRLNAKMVSEVWGIGLGVEGGTLTKNGVMKCLDEAQVEGEKGKKLRAAMEILRRKAIGAVGPQGSSTNNFTTLLELLTSTLPRKV